MEKEEKRALFALCWDNEKRVLKKYGYYYSEFVKKGRRPEDFEPVEEVEVERIVKFMKKHPVHPKRKRRKRIDFVDTYYLGNSYRLKHIIESFIGYVANGDFIAACMRINYLEVVPDSDGPNADIYIRRDRLDDYWGYCILVK